MTPWTVACQAPLSMEFSRQESWSGWPSPSPGDLPHPRIEPRSPALQTLPSEPPGKPSQGEREANQNRYRRPAPGRVLVPESCHHAHCTGEQDCPTLVSRAKVRLKLSRVQSSVAFLALGTVLRTRLNAQLSCTMWRAMAMSPPNRTARPRG